MRKFIVCIILMLVFVTGCQSSKENKREPAKKSVKTEDKATSSPSAGIPGLWDSLKIHKQEYDVSKSGKERKENRDRTIYFSNHKVLCYSKKGKEGEVFFLYERKKKRVIKS